MTINDIITGRRIRCIKAFRMNSRYYDIGDLYVIDDTKIGKPNKKCLIMPVGRDQLVYRKVMHYPTLLTYFESSITRVKRLAKEHLNE